MFTVGNSMLGIQGDIDSTLASLTTPFEFYASVLDEPGAASSSVRQLAAVSIAVAVGIFLVLQAKFESWRLAAMLFVAVPLSASGALAAAAIVDGTMSAGTTIGFVAVIALTTRHALLLFEHFARLQLDDGLTLDAELVRRGTRERFDPVVVSVLAAAVAMLPFVVFGTVAGLEVVRPLAVAVLGGLVSSLVVTLFVLPGLYMRFAAPAERPEALLSPVPAGS